MRIAMWSGPRNLSTALMYSFAARGDCGVWDEPFYAAYLQATGLPHPMHEAVIAKGPVDPFIVAGECRGPGNPDKPYFYQKHMTLHMVPGFPRDWMASCENVFLIRHPARVIASYAAKREGPNLADIGFVQQAELFDEIAHRTGHTPRVVAAEDIRANPRVTLMKLCGSLGLPFNDRMLHWAAGPKPYDGVWAPHWYNAVHRSTGFDTAEGPLPALEGDYAQLAEEAMPFYERLYLHKM
jgi:hypothetical protein